jgi:hypothetical protein
MTQPEKLPFLDDEKKNNTSDSKKMVELLEAIDWKLWMLYNMITKGELAVDHKVKNLDEPIVKKKLEKK